VGQNPDPTSTGVVTIRAVNFETLFHNRDSTR
jgi:hypothetical protein